MSPIILGLLLAAPISFITGRPPSRQTAALLATDIERQIPLLLASHASSEKELQIFRGKPAQLEE